MSQENAQPSPAPTGIKVPDMIFDPSNKKVKIITIGAGISGILMAYRAQKELKNVDFVVYEKCHDIGGTWLLNRYPGCACDVPSHAYQYNFAPNPDWPRFFSPSEDVLAYLDRVANKWNLRRFMNFNSEVTGCYWQEDTGKWRVRVRQINSNNQIIEFDDECDLLLLATGVLHSYKWPNIPGLLDRFKGKVIHTANWPKEYQAEQWEKENVAVIGAGSSSIQVVPSMQPYVKHLDVFARSPIWFTPIAGNEGINSDYTAEQKMKFRDPATLIMHAKTIEDPINTMLFPAMFKNSEGQNAAQQYIRARTASIIKDPELADRITPKWSLGCRRGHPGDPYMMAIQKKNVDVHFTGVVSVTEQTVVGQDGTEKEVDTIICATGFDTSYRPVFEIIGRNGVNLRQKWQRVPEGYLGLAIPDMPNLFTFIGPSWPIGNGSVMGPLEAVADYVIQFVQKIQNEFIKSFEPKQQVTDDFNEHVQEYMQGTIWGDECSSWYKDPETKRVTALWPGISLHYIEVIKSPRFEDYNFTYCHKNMWKYLGRGGTKALLDPASDRSPYLSVEAIDEQWLETEIIRRELTSQTMWSRFLSIFFG